MESDQMETIEMAKKTAESRKRREAAGVDALSGHSGRCLGEKRGRE